MSNLYIYSYHDRRESGSERFFFCFFSYIAKSVLPEGKQRREQKHELSNRICRHRRPFGAMIDRPAFAMGSAAHRRTPSSGQRRDGERSDVRPCACCGRTRRAEPTRCTRIRAAYSRRDRAGARRLDLDLTLTWLRAMAITEEEKQLREALRASLRTAAIEARSRAASRRLWQDAVAESLARAPPRRLRPPRGVRRLRGRLSARYFGCPEF